MNGILGFDDRQLSRLRAIANAVVAGANRREKAQCQVSVRRTVSGADVNLNYRPGVAKPRDALGYLGDLTDSIRSELRLEKNSIGDPIYTTTESTFTSGDDPSFQFQVMEAE